jgi:hypothetical protein
MLIEHMQSGYSYASFCAVIHVSDVCMDKWEKKYPEWAAAKKEAFKLCLLTWEKIGISITVGKTKGNVAAWIFNMKNRFGWRDRHEITGDPDKPLELRIFDYGVSHETNKASRT